MLASKVDSLHPSRDPCGPLDFTSALECIDDYLPKGEDRGKFTLHAIIIHCRPDVPVMSQEGSRKVVADRVLRDPGFFMDVLCLHPLAAEDLCESTLAQRQEQIEFFERLIVEEKRSKCSVMSVETEYDLFKCGLCAISHPLQRGEPLQDFMAKVPTYNGEGDLSMGGSREGADAEGGGESSAVVGEEVEKDAAAEPLHDVEVQQEGQENAGVKEKDVKEEEEADMGDKRGEKLPLLPTMGEGAGDSGEGKGRDENAN